MEKVKTKHPAFPPGEPPSPSLEPGDKNIRIVKAKEIAEFWDRDLQIPEDMAIEDVYRMYIWKMAIDDEGKKTYEKIDFPEDTPTLFGFTRAELKAIGGKGVFTIRLWDKIAKEWAGSKVVHIESAAEETKPQVEPSAVLPPDVPKPEEKEEEEMNGFIEKQVEKLETKVKELETDVKELTKEIRTAESKATTAENKVETIKLQKEEAEKRLESEKTTLEKERDRYKDDLEKTKENHTEQITKLQADFTDKMETKNKEIGDTKDKLSEAVRDKDHLQYESLLAKVKGGDGEGKNMSLLSEMVKSALDLKGKKLELTSDKEMKFGEMMWNYLMAQMEAQAEGGETPTEAEVAIPTGEPSITDKLGLPKAEQLLVGFLDPIQKLLSKAGLTLIHQVEVDKQIDQARKEGIRNGAKEGVERTAKKATVQIEKARRDGIETGKEQVIREQKKTKTPRVPTPPAETPPPEPAPEPEKPKKK